MNVNLGDIVPMTTAQCIDQVCRQYAGLETQQSIGVDKLQSCAQVLGTSGRSIGPGMPECGKYMSVAPSSAASITPSSITAAHETGVVRTKPAPITLTPPMPSITVPRSTHVTPETHDTFACWVNQNPLLAIAGAAALFFLIGGKRG